MVSRSVSIPDFSSPMTESAPVYCIIVRADFWFPDAFALGTAKLMADFGMTICFLFVAELEGYAAVFGATIRVTCGFALLLNESFPFSNIELVTF